MNTQRIFGILAALAAVVLLVACTTEREAVDKTDELALDKHLFDGEFFYRQTVVELPYTADYSFIGESNDGKIIRWKITKDWLIAYSILDKINIVDTGEQLAPNETPVLAYRILDHFDILPQENPTTGEAMPMYVPNRDRPWNERRYFTIDQASNATVNFELKYLWITQEWDNPFWRSVVTAATDLEFYAHDGSFIPPKKYADMLMEGNPADKEVKWFTFKSEEYLVYNNNWRYIYSWDDVEEFINTEPARIVYRHTFKKVNRDVVGKRRYDPATRQFVWEKGAKDNGFRPLEFPDYLFRKFGYFTNLYKGYDAEAGYREKDYHELANYWNIAWAKAGETPGTAKDWNFTCALDQGTAAKYNECLADLKYQQKLVLTSSAETPKRMLPANCAIAKDYNHAMLAARFAAMNPGSDTREFEKWYVANYKNDFFKKIKVGSKEVTVRDLEWYLNPPKDWEQKCFFPDEAAFIQKWNGDFIEDKYPNEIVVLVKNPVEAYIPARDGKHLPGAPGYDRYKNENNENAFFICVTPEEAARVEEGKLAYFENCLTNEEEMTALYTDEYGRSYWKGDRYDCKVLKKDETCPAGYVEAKAACEITDQRTCKFYDAGDGLPKLRHKYYNGDIRVALLNWVDQPTEFGILGVAQWNVNPETGQTLGAGANIAGSVLQWVMNRTVELARILISEDDPAAWDWEELTNPPAYSSRPKVVFDDNPDQMKPYVAKTNAPRIERNELLDPAIEIEQQQEKIKAILNKMTAKRQNYNRFDPSKLIGTKWETEMVPYSIRTAMFPWSDTSTGSWNYAEGERGILRRFISGPEAFNIEMLKYLEGMKYDFYMDETFLDGAIIQFLKEKQAALRKQYPQWKTTEKEKYVHAFIRAIYDELEPLTYKGVAQHELGHCVGLRHNFSASADQMNYLDGYFATKNYPTLLEKIKERVQEMYDEGRDPATMGAEIYDLKRSFESKMNYYTYVSIMDYQREAYIHALGLGKYDYAALKFVYGRSVEQYKTDAEGFVEMDTTNPIRDPRYPFPVLINKPFIDPRSGELIPVTEPKETISYNDPERGKVMRIVPAVQRDDLGFPVKDMENERYKPASYIKYFVNDKSLHRYYFFSDEMQTDEPMNKVFDGGYTGADSVRFMANTEQSFYFTRFFKRGNPKFREFRGRTWYKMILDTLLDKYKYVHYLLDLNYNALRGGWFGHVIQLWNSEDGCGTIRYPLGWSLADKRIEVTDWMCKDYQKGIRGIEYWIDENGELQTLTPFGPGDYIVAGMVGINYLLHDILYRPDANEYLRMTPEDDYDDTMSLKLEAGQEGYWIANPYVIDGETIGNKEVNFGIDPDTDLMYVSPVYGRYHRDHWDIQDDPTTYYDKVIRRGFSEEKAVAIFALSNQGWFSGKYMRESMANGLGQLADGVNNLIFAMFGDIANEDWLISFTPYCVKKGTNKIVKVDVPITTYLYFRGEPPLHQPDGSERSPYFARDLPKNLCSAAKDPNDPTAVFEPVHAGWIYFDKLVPLYWGLGNVMNASADTSVLLKFGTFTYGTYRTDVRPPDVDEIEVLNSLGNMYYRAKIPQSDLSAIDRADLAWWKARKAAGASDAEALCEWETQPSIGPDGSLTTEKKCLTDGMGNFVQKYPSKEAFHQYLEDTYMRFAPAYRLVKALSIISSQGGTGGQQSSDPTNYKVTVMETTLDQLNTFIADQFGTAIMYAYFI